MSSRPKMILVENEDALRAACAGYGEASAEADDIIVIQSPIVLTSSLIVQVPVIIAFSGEQALLNAGAFPMRYEPLTQCKGSILRFVRL